MHFLLLLCFRSAYTVLKFMMMWTLVLLADFILEFRLEYLWPCWLFFGSVYTTFHCHGLVRSPAVWLHIVCSGPDDDYPTEWIQCILLKLMFSLFAGYLCCFCLCCVHSGHLLFNFCSSALAVLCGEHLRIIQLHMAHGWVWGLLFVLFFLCPHKWQNMPNSVPPSKYNWISSDLSMAVFFLSLHIWLFNIFLQRKASVYRRCLCGFCLCTRRLHFDSKTLKPLMPTCLIFLLHTGMLI